MSSNPFDQPEGIFEINIDNAAREHLRIAATWARIMAIIGFIGAGLSILEIILVKTDLPAMAVASQMLVTLITVAVTVIINVFLFRFGTNTLASLQDINQVQFNEGVGNLRTYLKIMGILIILGVSFVLIFFLAFGVGMGARG